MNSTTTAHQLLDALGGSDNVHAVAKCMTRLRLELDEPDLANYQDLTQINRVLSARPRGASCVEVVFGPAVVSAVAQEIARITGLSISSRNTKARRNFTPSTSLYGKPRVSTSRLYDYDYTTPSKSQKLDRSDLDHLRDLLESVESESDQKDASGANELSSKRVLVANGPNMNLLGIREPGLYGQKTYDDLVELCLETGNELGFGDVRCFQSNHEGDLVDVIQEARHHYDGIVLNPAAYTHTSIAILDALKAVQVPCVEVHVSDVAQREDFRRISYVRAVCIACVMGEGLKGYAHALAILADHLKAQQLSTS